MLVGPTGAWLGQQRSFVSERIRGVTKAPFRAGPNRVFEEQLVDF